MAAMAPTSPRLPSPPPAAEIQLGPKSPNMNTAAGRQVQQMEQSVLNANAKRRIHPGTKNVDFAAGPPLIPLHELDSAFQLQEHLAALHYHHTASNTEPINRTTAKLLANPPAGIDRTLWLYELCRFLIAQCNSLIVGFLFDTPPCSAATCPEMRASEWQFLCAVHDAPKSCCAIDYCCHTLDWAANVVTNPKIFPSRFVLADSAHDKSAAVKNLVNVFRRLHRIFAHAWFQHRGVFWSVEALTGHYVLFKTVCDLYDLLPAENYKLPPEAEGLETAAFGADHDKKPAVIPRPQQQHHGEGSGLGLADDEHLQPVGRTNTRRHIRSNPSVGSAVTTVMEQDEDDGSAADVTGKMREMRISAPETADEDTEMGDVPVIVEQGMMEDKAERPDSPAQHTDASDETLHPDAAAKDDEPAVETTPGEAEPDATSPEAETPVATKAKTETAAEDPEPQTALPVDDDDTDKDKKIAASMSKTSINDFATKGVEKVAGEDPQAVKEDDKEDKSDSDGSSELTPSDSSSDAATSEGSSEAVHTPPAEEDLEAVD